MFLWIIIIFVIVLLIILRYTFGYIGLENKEWNPDKRIKDRLNIFSNNSIHSQNETPVRENDSVEEPIETFKIDSVETAKSDSIEIDSVESSSDTEFTKEQLEDFYKCERPYIPYNCSVGEKECRRVLRKYFGLPFKSCRPHFLMNPETWSRLELDCYEGSLRLACEYQGRQHYYHTKQFHSSEEEFIKQCERDRIKTELCKTLGIYLIRVPYSVSKKDIESYILERLPPKYKKLKKK